MLPVLFNTPILHYPRVSQFCDMLRLPRSNSVRAVALITWGWLSLFALLCSVQLFTISPTYAHLQRATVVRVGDNGYRQDVFYRLSDNRTCIMRQFSDYGGFDGIADNVPVAVMKESNDIGWECKRLDIITATGYLLIIVYKIGVIIVVMCGMLTLLELWLQVPGDALNDVFNNCYQQLTTWCSGDVADESEPQNTEPDYVINMESSTELMDFKPVPISNFERDDEETESKYAEPETEPLILTEETVMSFTTASPTFSETGCSLSDNHSSGSDNSYFSLIAVDMV
jgi:hypothetical protein